MHYERPSKKVKYNPHYLHIRLMDGKWGLVTWHTKNLPVKGPIQSGNSERQKKSIIKSQARNEIM